MASAGDIHSILYRGDVCKAPVPKYDPTKFVQRYFPGKAPAFKSDVIRGKYVEDSKGTSKHSNEVNVAEAFDSDDEVSRKVRATRRVRKVIERAQQNVNIEAENREGVAHISNNIDNNRINSDNQLSRKERRLKIMELREKEEQTLITDPEETTEISEEIVKKSELQTNSLKGAECYEDMLSTNTQSESDEVENSLYEDSEIITRPVFIPITKRIPKSQEFLQSSSKLDDIHQDDEIQISKDLLHSAILEDIKPTKCDQTHFALIDDNDDLDFEEYNKWKDRELNRLKKAFLIDEVIIKEHKILESRRKMNDDERKINDACLDSIEHKKTNKRKYSFLQKYYHKGVFFQDLAQSGAEELYLRDFNVPVGEDKVDKLNLPAPMQLRRGQFGKSGRTKHTHLLDVDTTDFSNPWSNKKNNLYTKNMKYLAGLKGAYQFTRPSKKAKS